MKVTPTALDGLLVLEPRLFGDSRGWFMESFNQARWEAGLRELGDEVRGSLHDDGADAE